MGQYYLIVNLDRKEYLDPHDFNDGAKLMEFGASANGTLSALARLLLLNKTKKNRRWAGSRLVVAGDYADNGKFLPESQSEQNLYAYVSDSDEFKKPRKEHLHRQPTEKKLPPGSWLMTGEDDISSFEDIFERMELTPTESLIDSMRELIKTTMYYARVTALAKTDLAYKLSDAEVLQASYGLDAAGQRVEQVSISVALKDGKTHKIEWAFPLAMADFKASLGIKS
jgi:hypothetical protein